MKGPRLILASASPRRREILALLGVPFDVLEASEVDEEAVRGDARGVAMLLARLKAEAVRRRAAGEAPGSPAIVLAGDTVVALGEGPDDVLGKPRDADHAREMIRRLSGRTHTVWTGIALAPSWGAVRVEAEATRVSFRRLSGDDIEAYLATGDHEGKAGAYGIQGAASALLIDGFQGCYWNVVGLPLARAARLLAEHGLAPRADCDCLAHPLQRGVAGCG